MVPGKVGVVSRTSDLLLPAVFLGREAVAEGVLTPKQLRGPSVQRVLRGVYAPAGLRVTHAVRCAAAGLVLDPAAQLTGRSMATVLGVPLAGPGDPVEALVPDASQQERYSGISFRRVTAPLEPGTRWERTTLATTTRMAFDLAARRDVATGVGHLDAVVRAGLVDLDAARTWLVGRRDHDVVAVRRAFELVDPRAESMPESAVRVHLVLAGLDPTPQYLVRLRGRVVARVDLALVEHRVAVEYDGAWHALREQLERDRARLNDLREAGWVVVHVTADMLRRPTDVVAAVRRAITATEANTGRSALGRASRRATT